MDYTFTTERLMVKEWRSFEPQEISEPDLVSVVEEILVPDVTKRFPIMWRGDYDRKRAEAWIKEQNSETKTLLAVEKESKKPIGFINFFKVGAKSLGAKRSEGTYFRLGYMLNKVMWNNGFATEFVDGFLDWSKKNDVLAILARVEPDNIASIRVLEKNNFSTQTTDSDGRSLLFLYDLV